MVPNPGTRDSQNTSASHSRSPFEFATSDAFCEPEQFLSALFHSSTVGICLLDTKLQFVAINEALAAMNGFPVKNHLGKEIRNILGPAYRQFDPIFKRVLATGEALPNLDIKVLLPTRNQTGRWIETFFPVKSRTGQVKQIGVTVIEVSDHSTIARPHENHERPNVVEHETAEQSDELRAAMFNGMDQNMARMFSRNARVRKFIPGDVFCIQGRKAESLFLLTRGMVKLTAITRSGREVVLDWMGPGEIFGIGAFLSPPFPHLWSVVAVEDCEALSWSRVDLAQFAALAPQAFENALAIAMRLCAELQQRIEELSDGFVQQRVAHLVLHLADSFKNNRSAGISVTNEELANMAGTNLFSVNKLLNRWQRLGYITKSRRCIRILDFDRLKQLSLEKEQVDGKVMRTGLSSPASKMSGPL